MQIVNGYVCQNCTDVEYAKKGVDPAHPKDPPAQPGGGRPDRSRDSADFGPAVLVGGALWVTPTGRTDPPSAYPVGSTFSLRV